MICLGLCSFQAPVAVLGQARAQDSWPNFLGPDGNAQGQPLQLADRTQLEPNLLWTKEIPGKGWSSPVFAQGLVFLTSAIPVSGEKSGDLDLTVIALNAATGEKEWSTKVKTQDGATAPKIHSKNSHASPTIAVGGAVGGPMPGAGGGERLYVHFGHMGTGCLDLKGKVLWFTPGLYQKPVHGGGGSPILTDGLVIFSIDAIDLQAVVALKQSDGTLAWKTERNASPSRPFSFSTPTLVTHNGTRLLLSPGSDVLMALDPATGQEIWRVPYKGYSVIPRPAILKDLAFVSTSYDNASLLAVKLEGSGKRGEEAVAWKMTKAAPHTPSPLVVGDLLFVVSDNGIASCLDPQTGNVHWQERLGNAYSSSPWFEPGAKGGIVWFQSETGEVHQIRASKKFEKVAKWNLKERTLASHAPYKGELFIRTETHLIKLGSKSRVEK